MPRLTKRLVVEKHNYITTVGTSSLTCPSPCYSFLPHMVLTNSAGTLSSPGEINMKSFQQAQMPHDLFETLALAGSHHLLTKPQPSG